MRIVLQRVERASVTVDGEAVASIGAGLVILVGVAVGDDEADAVGAARKIADLRVFSDTQQKMNRSLLDVGGAALVVSQFTLLADARHGRRPAFIGAAPSESAAPLVELLADSLRDLGIPTSQGVFGAKMKLELTNDGPVTLVLEVRDGSVVSG